MAAVKAYDANLEAASEELQNDPEIKALLKWEDFERILFKIFYVMEYYLSYGKIFFEFLPTGFKIFFELFYIISKFLDYWF